MSEAPAATGMKPSKQKDDPDDEQLINPYRSDRSMPSDFATSVRLLQCSIMHVM